MNNFLLRFGNRRQKPDQLFNESLLRGDGGVGHPSEAAQKAGGEHDPADKMADGLNPADRWEAGPHGPARTSS